MLGTKCKTVLLFAHFRYDFLCSVDSSPSLWKSHGTVALNA